MMTENRPGGIWRRLAAPAMAGALFCAGCAGIQTEAGSGSRRSFHLGFTPFVFDNRPEATDAVYQTIDAHSDMISLHMDFGVPWSEALNKEPYSPAIEREIALRKKHIRPGQKVYLALNPLNLMRNNLAAYWGGDWGEDWDQTLDKMRHAERQEEWNRKTFDDPEVAQAYLNHCRRMINEFQPDFMAYGVEVNFLPMSNPDAYPAYLRFVQKVYPVLKQEYPDLPLFLTFQIDHYQTQSEQLERIFRELLRYSDYVAVSTYPYMGGHSPETLPDDWFTRVAALAPDKPFCIAETGFIAEPMPPLEAPPADPFAASLDKRVWRASSEEAQAAYVERILSDMQRLDGRFVTWFFPHDVDRFWRSTTDPKARDFIITWRDSGLVDGEGASRKGLAVWDAWLKKPHAGKK